MSPRKQVSRQAFVDALWGDLNEGRYGVSVAELCHRLGVTKGSFYSHFSGQAELHAEVVRIWLAGRAGTLPDPAAGSVMDPVDALRKIREALSATAVLDGAIRRWAADERAARRADGPSRPPEVVEDAVVEADRIAAGYLARALIHLGLAGDESAFLAAFISAALRAPEVAADRDGFEALLELLARAVAFPSEASGAGGAAPDAVALYRTAVDLRPEHNQVLRRLARMIADGQAAEELPAGGGEAEAGRG